MTVSAPRNYTGLAVAIVAAALIVGASIYVAFSGVSTTTVTDTETLPVTTTISTTTTCLCPTAPAPCPCASQEESTTSTYGGGGSTVTTTTSTGASIATTTASTSNANNLELSLGIRSNGGANITISAEETNLLSSENNVTAASNWSYPNSDLLCGANESGGNFEAGVYFPMEISVLQGNYGAGNYTSGTALTLQNTGDEYACGGVIQAVQYYVFAPDSDNASFYFGSAKEGGYSAFEGLTTDGYLTGSGSTAEFRPFQPGTYTVLAEDEWGDVVLLHFTVVVSSVTETVSSTVFSTSAVSSSSSSSTCTAASPHAHPLPYHFDNLSRPRQTRRRRPRQLHLQHNEHHLSLQRPRGHLRELHHQFGESRAFAQRDLPLRGHHEQQHRQRDDHGPGVLHRRRADRPVPGSADGRYVHLSRSRSVVRCP